jgi:anti-sigma B factor antagonist
MFDIKVDEDNTIQLSGRFDASQTDKAKIVFNEVASTTYINFKDLEYISSAGLGVLLMTQKRLNETGCQLILLNMNNHIREIFKYAGFDMIFEIEE